MTDVTNRWLSLGKAIECFENAVKAGGEHKFEAHMSLGRLYSSIGQVDAALINYGAAEKATMDLTNKAAAIAEKAKLLIVLGKRKDATDALLLAIKLNSLDLNYFLPLVLVYKDLDDLQLDEWRALIQKIESQVERQIRRKGILGDNRGGHHTGSNSVGRDVYWALFEAYDQIHEYAKAWNYLEKAQKFVSDIQSLTSKSSSRSTRDAVKSQDILVHNILSQMPKPRRYERSDEKTLTRDPIFLVGMPR